jgi:hypothetical protein
MNRSNLEKSQSFWNNEAEFYSERTVAESVSVSLSVQNDWCAGEHLIVQHGWSAQLPTGTKIVKWQSRKKKTGHTQGDVWLLSRQ